MPKLRRYKRSSEKSGYYIQANVGAPHPITLQVTSIAERIFQKTGYEPGENIPTKLVWAMYDLNLLYTNTSLDPSAAEDVSTEDILRELDLGNRLSTAEKEEVISYIEQYEGPQKDTLYQLKEELENSSSTVDTETTLTASTRTSNVGVPDSKAEAVAYLFQVTGDITRFRRAKNRVDQEHLLRSLQTFLPHPPVEESNTQLTRNWTVKYHLSHPDREAVFWLTDHPGVGPSPSDHPIDYELTINPPKSKEKGEAAIQDREVVEGTADLPSEYSHEELEADLMWILPEDPVERNEDLTRITEYEGYDLCPIRAVKKFNEKDVAIVEVDRISNSGNPVAETSSPPQLLNGGDPGEKYLVEKTGNRWKLISEVID